MVFISYSSKDYVVATKIRKRLCQNNIDCWMAPDSIPVGSNCNYAHEIQDAIETSDYFLIVLSENSQKSVWVQKELDFAIIASKTILPIVIDTSILTESFRFRLSNVQWLDASSRFDEILQIVSNRINGIDTVPNESDVTSYSPEALTFYKLLGIEDSKRPYVFVSYAHADKTSVLPIISHMIHSGYRIWYDDGIDPGSEWDDNIARHIQDCSFFIAFVSKKYLVSDNCKDELNYARDLKKERLLVYLEDVELPAGMAMRLNRMQALYWNAYRDKTVFYNKLFMANSFELCRDESWECEEISSPTIHLNGLEKDCRLFKSESLNHIPDDCSLYELLDADDCLRIDIKSIRADRDASKSLRVPIGIGKGGQVMELDLHSDGDGPNGLIFGSPASGKSEFLKTLCISLAIHHTLDDVKMNIIDCKGGLLADSLKEIPHVEYIVMDLSDAAFERYIDYMDKELHRRMLLLSKHMVLNINQYLELRNDPSKHIDPLPHLIIMIDEFAEIRVCAPRMYNLLKNWALNAKSLGIHIILATQLHPEKIESEIVRLGDFQVYSKFEDNELYQIKRESKLHPGRFRYQIRSLPDSQIIQVANSSVKRPNCKETGNGRFTREIEQASEIIELIIKHNNCC